VNCDGFINEFVKKSVKRIILTLQKNIRIVISDFKRVAINLFVLMVYIIKRLDIKLLTIKISSLRKRIVI